MENIQEYASEMPYKGSPLQLQREVEFLRTANKNLHDQLQSFWNTHVVPLQEENQRLKNDLLDALDLKEGNGPTALSMAISENKVLRDWKESALAVFSEWDRVSDYIKPRCRLGDKYSARALELFKMIDAENKALREENTRLTTKFIEEEHAADHPNESLSYWQYQQFTRAAITKLREEIDRLKAEVLKEKFPEN